ncbi:hypothetical protein WS67_04240 [Burkholderia singularis]|uniref:DUF4148 domain-containing protein n=1 Tax=Burkholderia singularis TaxID=1503053 RepID=A0A103E834_9BURK|nr:MULTISPECIES: DUF4148 domain-containing protein [Burkholderia]AOK32376.1 hypothetical protein AQ611_23430 [Burkholderia sp. Bp7605]KVE30074.1 hypothetical protein WS67_04240 [Burkholderia singularis]
MKRSSLLAIAAVALAATAPAFATDNATGHAGDYVNASRYESGPRTRADVQAELERAQRDGTLAALRKSMSYAPPGAPGVELAQRAYRPDPNANQLAGAGR